MPPTQDRRPLLFAAGAAALALIAPALLRGEGLLATAALWRVPPWSGFLPPRPGAGLLADQLLYLAPWRQFLREELLSGSLPLWNPFLLAGVPFAACVQAAIFYPLNLLLFWLPAVPFSLAAAFLKIFCAAWFTGLHLRRLGASPRGQIVGAFTFGLGGFMVAWLGHPHTNTACLLPGLFWALGELADAPSPRRAAALGLIAGVAALGGHPPTMLHVFGAASAYALLLAARAGARRSSLLLHAAAAALAGLALAAPALLPFLEYHALSSTAGASAALARWGTRLSPWTLVHLLMPLASGSPALGGEVLGGVFGFGPETNFVERAAWTGVIPLVFAVLAVCARRRNGDAPFHAALALFGLAAALGLPPLPWLWKMLPGYSSVNPTRLLLLWSFGVATLAGLGAELSLEDVTLETRRLLPILYWAVPAIAGLLYWGLVWRVLDELSFGENLFALAVMGLFLAEWAAGLRVITPKGRASATGLTALFLLVPALGVNPSAPASTFYPVNADLTALREAAGDGRAFGLGRAVEPDLGMPLRLRDARGRDFASPRRYEELVTGRSGDFDFYGGPAALPPNPSLLAISAVAATEKTLSAVPRDWKNSYAGSLFVFTPPVPARRALFVGAAKSGTPAEVLAAARAPGFDPRALVLLDDGEAESFRSHGTARLTADGTDSVTVEVASDGPGWLVLLDGWFPGWEATVDGEPARVRRADYAFRAVRVGAGKSVVRFDYRPRPLRLGLWVAAAAAAALALAAFL